MTKEEAIHELQEDKRLYETEVCYAGDGTPDGRLLEALDMAIEALSAEPQSDDLIIKGAKGVKDGLYNIKDGKLFQYMAKGGTARTYKILSAEWQGEVVRCKNCKWRKINRKSGTLNCGHEYGMITAKDDNFCNYGERSE